MRGNPRVKSFGPTARVLATSVLDSNLRGSPVASDDLAPPVEIVTDESVERIDRGVAPPPDDWVSRPPSTSGSTARGTGSASSASRPTHCATRTATTWGPTAWPRCGAGTPRPLSLWGPATV